MRSGPATEPRGQHPGPAGWRAAASAAVSAGFVLTAETGREKGEINIHKCCVLSTRMPI